jgi:hypothetical protein
MRPTASPRASTLRRIAWLALAALALSGCVVVPAYPYHHWGPRYYY